MTGKYRRRKTRAIKFGKKIILEINKKKKKGIKENYALKCQNPQRPVAEQKPKGEKPLGWPGTRWKDVVKKGVEALGGGPNLRSWR